MRCLRLLLFLAPGALAVVAAALRSPHMQGHCVATPGTAHCPTQPGHAALVSLQPGGGTGGGTGPGGTGPGGEGPLLPVMATSAQL
jgi:hypothetical protein